MKIGDRVRITSASSGCLGLTGTVLHRAKDFAVVKLDGAQERFLMCTLHELEGI